MANQYTAIKNQITALKSMKPKKKDQRDNYNKMMAEMEKLVTLMDQFYVKDRESYPAVTAKDKEDLLACYQMAGAYAEAFIAAYGKEKGLASLIRGTNHLRLMLNRDSSTILDYNPDQELCSLPQLIERSRTYVMDLGDMKIKTVGGNVSQRIPVSYTGADGVNHIGVFTEKKMVNVAQEFVNVLQDMDKGKKYKFGPVFWDFYVSKIQEENANQADARLADPNNPLAMGLFAYDVEQEKQNPIMTYDVYNFAKNNHLEDRYGWPKSGDKDFRLFVDMLDSRLEEWKSYLKRFSRDYGIQIINGKIVEPCRIDSRNTGMSRVAALLGVPELLAHAEPMKIRHNGKEIEGTFMAMGDGIDVHYPTEASLSYTKDNFKGKGLKSVADLQVLDYICGNTDRHAGNMLYRFDTTDPDPHNHVFLGVQGIDNDLSFGNIFSKELDKHHVYMNSIKSMKIVSESMAKAVMKLKTPVLRFQLRDLGLTEKQIKFAQKRFEFLRDHIKMSINKEPDACLRIVSDQEFETMKVEDVAMSPYEIRHAHNFDQFTLVAMFHGQLEKKNVGKSMQVKDVSKDTGWFMPHGETQHVEEMIARMHRATAGGETSVEYDEMLKSLDKYRLLTEKLGYTSLTPARREERKACMQDIQQKAVAYLKNTVGTAETDNLVKEIGKWAETRVDSWNKVYAPESPEYKQIMEVCHKREEDEVARLNMEMRKLANEIHAKQLKEQAEKANGAQEAGKAEDKPAESLEIQQPGI